MKKGLNYNWKFKRNWDLNLIEKEILDGDIINIPHSNILLPFNYINEKDYQFKSTYQLKFDVDKISNHMFIEFEAVAHYAKVYLNGNYLGEHEGGYTSFKFEISKYVTFKDNLLTVFVNSNEEECNFPPFGNVIDYLTYGGIYREVNLIFKNEIFIEDLYTYAIDVLNDKKIGITLKTNKHNENLLVDFIWKKDGKIVKEILNQKILENYEINFDELNLWDSEDPNLYEFSAVLKIDSNEIDRKILNVGYRDAKFTSKGFYLNGKLVKIVGLNRHQSYPYVGYAMPKSAQIKDAEILKYELGINMVRSSHYPASKHFLAACDKIGLLVFEEIPGWQNVGDEKWQETACKNVEEMILMHKNHPSIVIWGVRINESQDFNDFYFKTNSIARKLDPYRQTGGVRNIEMVKPNKDAFLEDVYTYNDFDYRINHPLTPTNKLFPIKNIAGLVTEHSGHTFPTKSFDNEERRTIHALRHANIINYMKGDKNISGTIGWCAFDYNTHVEFGSGDRICYHGVLDMFRNDKLAASIYAAEGLKKPYLKVSTTNNMGEHDRAVINGAYIFTNCDYVKMYRNDEFFGILYPDRNTFKNLKHPPIEIDYFGDVLKNIEGYDEKDAKRIKEINKAICKYSIHAIPLKYRKMLKSPAELETITKLYNKYILNWGGNSITYRFDGFIDERQVLSQKVGSEYESTIKIKIDSTVLKNEETYDVTRITIEKINENENRQIYANDVISIETDDKVEIIGDKNISLIGGIRSFWIKSIPNKKGISEIKITHNNVVYNRKVEVK